MRESESNQEWPQTTSSITKSHKLLYQEENSDRDALMCKPIIDKTAWVSPGATLIGHVRLKAQSSVWYGCVLRGDSALIEIDEKTNIQDGSILHAELTSPCILGKRISVGHRAIVHSSEVQDDALIGIGAIVLSRCVIGHGALIAAGSLIREGTHVPPESFWAGVPAREKKDLTPELKDRMRLTNQHYVNLAAAYLKKFGRKHIDELQD